MRYLDKRINQNQLNKGGKLQRWNFYIVSLFLLAIAGGLLGLVLGLSLTKTAEAGLDEKIAASFAAKYQVCALKLKDTRGYRLKALGLKVKADEIGRDKLGGGGYIQAFQKEKKKAWELPLRKCKKLADRL